MTYNKEVGLLNHIGEIVIVHFRSFHKRIVLNIIGGRQISAYRIQFPEGGSADPAGEGVGNVILFINVVTDAGKWQQITVVPFYTKIRVQNLPEGMCVFQS